MATIQIDPAEHTEEFKESLKLIPGLKVVRREPREIDYADLSVPIPGESDYEGDEEDLLGSLDEYEQDISGYNLGIIEDPEFNVDSVANSIEANYDEKGQFIKDPDRFYSTFGRELEDALARAETHEEYNRILNTVFVAVHDLTADESQVGYDNPQMLEDAVNTVIEGLEPYVDVEEEPDRRPVEYQEVFLTPESSDVEEDFDEDNLFSTSGPESDYVHEEIDDDHKHERDREIKVDDIPFLDSGDQIATVFKPELQALLNNEDLSPADVQNVEDTLLRWMDEEKQNWSGDDYLASVEELENDLIGENPYGRGYEVKNEFLRERLGDILANRIQDIQYELGELRDLPPHIVQAHVPWDEMKAELGRRAEPESVAPTRKQSLLFAGDKKDHIGDIRIEWGRGDHRRELIIPPHTTFGDLAKIAMILKTDQGTLEDYTRQEQIVITTDTDISLIISFIQTMIEQAGGNEIHLLWTPLKRHGGIILGGTLMSLLKKPLMPVVDRFKTKLEKYKEDFARTPLSRTFRHHQARGSGFNGSNGIRGPPYPYTVYTTWGNTPAKRLPADRENQWGYGSGKTPERSDRQGDGSLRSGGSLAVKIPYEFANAGFEHLPRRSYVDRDALVGDDLALAKPWGPRPPGLGGKRSWRTTPRRGGAKVSDVASTVGAVSGALSVIPGAAVITAPIAAVSSVVGALGKLFGF